MAETRDQAAATDFREPSFVVSLLGAALPGLYLLITSTTTLVTSIWPYDFKRLLEFGLLLVLFVLPLISRSIRMKLDALLAGVPRWIVITLLCIITWGVLSAAFNARGAMHFANSLSEVALLTVLGFGVFVVAACRSESRRSFDQLAIGLLALTGLAVGLQELMGVIAAWTADSAFSYEHALIYFSHARFYNQVQSWTVPLLAALPLLFSRHRVAGVWCALTLGLQWYILLMTGARGSILGITVAVSAAILIFPALRKPMLFWQVSGLVLGVLVYLLVLLAFEAPANSTSQEAATQQNSATTTFDRDGGLYGNEDGTTSAFLAQSLARPMGTSTGRVNIWKGVIIDAMENPLMGIGPMNYACSGRGWFGHPHSFPLQLLGEWGLPAAFAVFGLMIALFLQAVAKVRHSLRDGTVPIDLSGYLLTAVMAASIHAFFSGILVMPSSQVAGLMICGMLLGVICKEPVRFAGGFAKTATVIALVMCIALLALGIREIQTMDTRAALLEQPRLIAPRIWQDSKVCSLYSAPIGVRN